MTRSSVFALLVAIGCGDSNGSGGAGSGEGSSDQGSDASDGSGDATTTAPGSSDGGSGSGEGDDGPRYDVPPRDTPGGGAPSVCVAECMTDADCCDDCPGDYPNNVTCIDRHCQPGGCGGDEDCTGLYGDGWECHPVRGVPACVPLCSNDEFCNQPNAFFTCTGMADDGTEFCIEGCDSPYNPCPEGLCLAEDGRCGCLEDGDCPEGSSCVSPHGCATAPDGDHRRPRCHPPGSPSTQVLDAVEP